MTVLDRTANDEDQLAAGCGAWADLFNAMCALAWIRLRLRARMGVRYIQRWRVKRRISRGRTRAADTHCRSPATMEGAS